MKYLLLLTLASPFFAVQSALACKTYTVTLVKVGTNQAARGAALLIVHEKIPLDKTHKNDGKRNSWSFQPKQLKHVDVTCLEGDSLSASFVLRLEAVHADDNSHIGTLKATLVREGNEVKLVIERKMKDRFYRVGRRKHSRGETFWVTRVFRVGSPANYILEFKIERAGSPANSREINSDDQKGTTGHKP